MLRTMRLLALLSLVATSMCPQSQSAPPDAARSACKPEPPPADKGALERTRNLFVERAKVAGVPMPAPPALAEDPKFADLPPSQRGDIEKAAGSAAAAPCFYAWMYGWYLQPRELARNLVDASNAQPKERQQLEDDLTVAFIFTQQGGEERLVNLQSQLDAARGDDQKRILASIGRRHELKFDALVATLKK
jgi:hypothetical protein